MTLPPINLHFISNTNLPSEQKTPVGILLTQADEFKKKGDKQALQLHNLSDRELFQHETQQLYQKITDTINLLSAQGRPFEEIRQRVSTALDLYRGQLTSSFKQFKENETRFNADSSAFNPAAARAARTTAAANGGSNIFAPPQVMLSDRMKQRKAVLSQCLLTSMDPESITGAMPCVAKHEKGLSESEKKELHAAVPNLVAGKVITELAIVPAVVSKVVNKVVTVTVKGLVLGSVAEGLVESKGCQVPASVVGGNPHTEPKNHHEFLQDTRQAFNGKNSQFNQVMREIVPEPVKRGGMAAGAIIQQGVNYAAEVDKYTQERFGTLPGVVEAGIIGTVELGTAALAGPAIKGSIRLVRAAARGTGHVYRAIGAAIKASSDKRVVAKAIEAISARRPYWSTRVEMTAEWNERMAGVSAILPDYSIGSYYHPVMRFIASLPNGEARFLEYIRSPNAQLWSAAGENVGNDIFVKAASLAEFGKDTLGGQILTDLGLTESKIPLIVKIGQYYIASEPTASTLIARTGMQGVPMDSVLVQSGAENAVSAGKKLGAVVGEIHKKTHSNLRPSMPFLKEEVKRLWEAYQAAKRYYEDNGVKFILTEARLAHINNEFIRNPGFAGVALDMDLAHFIWNEATKEMTLINTGNLVRSLNGVRWPAGVPALDYVKIRSLLSEVGAKADMTPRGISNLLAAFEEGYGIQVPNPIHTPEALRFYQLLQDLLNVPKNIPTPPTPPKLPEGIRSLFNRFRRDEMGGGKIPTFKTGRSEPAATTALSDTTVSVHESSWVKTVIFSVKKVDETTSLAFVNKIASKAEDGLAHDTLKRLKQIASDQGSQRLLLQFAVQNERIYKIASHKFQNLGRLQNPFTEHPALFQTFEIPLETFKMQRNRTLDYYWKLAGEFTRLESLKAKIPGFVPPEGWPTSTYAFSKNSYQKHHLKISRTIDVNIFIKEFEGRAFYIHRPTSFGESPVTIKSYLSADKKFTYCLKALLDFAEGKNLNTVTLAYDPKLYNITGFMEYHDIPITSIGSLPTVDSKILTVIEFPATSARAALTSTPS